VRLGFAIAAHLQADILLVDEVLAVGDIEFQARCMSRIQDLKRSETTMLLVSHDLGAIEQLSDRAILIDRGRVAAAGSPHDVVSRYQRLVSGTEEPAEGEADHGNLDTPVAVEALTLHGADGHSLLAATAGAFLEARVSLALNAPVPVTIRLSFFDYEKGTLLTECTGEVDPASLPAAPGASIHVQVRFVMPELLLAPGSYTLGVTATPARSTRPAAWRFGRTTLYVQAGSAGHPSGGVFVQPFQTHVSTAETTTLDAVR
jgi:hypothetical protein